MNSQKRPRADVPADTREGAHRVWRDDLELPRPWRLALIAGWNLAESLGLPVAGYLAGAALGGQAAGMVVASGVLWLTVAVRKVAARGVPGPLAISALILTLQTALVTATGSRLVFLLQFPLANVASRVLFAGAAPFWPARTLHPGLTPVIRSGETAKARWRLAHQTLRWGEARAAGRLAHG